MTGPALADRSGPAGPLLSMYDPIYIGIDEFGHPVWIRLIYKNLLAAGEPGGGKSGLLNTLAASALTSYVLTHGHSPLVLAQAAVHSYIVGFWVSAGILAGSAIVCALVLASGRLATAAGPTPPHAG